MAFAAALTMGCDDGKADPPAPAALGRSNAVAAASGAASAPAQAPSRAAPTAAPRKLCTGQTQRSAPTSPVKTMSAPGAAPLPGSLSFGVGKWVWVNLWAAWCAPCKEEMPRLLAWREKLRAAGVLVDLAFVSMDDDDRQLQRFLEAQPQAGVRASYWLPDGPDRASFLGSLGLRETVELPVHALVAPSGQVSCVVEGAVEDRDYAALAAFLGAKL